ncbi:MAG: adenylate/guanylate cyclase domain-containing protein [Pseudomonadota bacterium]
MITPGWVWRMADPCARALHLATLLIVFALCLSSVMLLNNLLFPIAEAGPEFYRLSINFTSAFTAISAAAYLAMWLRLASVARPLLLLFGLSGVGAYAYMIGPEAGADVIGAICVVFLPALIYSSNEKRQRLIAIALVVLATIAIQYWMSYQPAMFELPPEEIGLLRFNVILVAVALGVFVIYLHQSAERAKLALAIEKERADDLLLNILPADVAARLKTERALVAGWHDEVCILFADIVGFTRMSADRPAAEIVTILNHLFSRFDTLCDTHDVEKIKTIGDGYFAASGLCGRPKQGDPAVALAHFALAMRDAAAEMVADLDEPFSIRIGLHLGPAVSGVIGTRKFAFDIWGATVNMASRMESNSKPGAITISKDYRDRIADRFDTQPLGSITAKGVGEVEVFALLGAKTPAPLKEPAVAA